MVPQNKKTPSATDSIRQIKGELNLDKKWQSDDLFYIIMNEIHPRLLHPN